MGSGEFGQLVQPPTSLSTDSAVGALLPSRPARPAESVRSGRRAGARIGACRPGGRARSAARGSAQPVRASRSRGTYGIERSIPLSPNRIRSVISIPVPVSPVVVAEQHAGYRDGKTGCARQRGEPHLRLHLGFAAVPRRIIEVAGELHEQLGRQPRRRLVVFARTAQLCVPYCRRRSRETPPMPLTRFPRQQHTRCAKCLGEKAGSASLQGGGVSGNRQAELVAGDPTIIHSITRSVRPHAPTCG